MAAAGQQSFRADVVIAGILVVAVIAVVLDRALLAVESRMSSWRAF